MWGGGAGRVVRVGFYVGKTKQKKMKPHRSIFFWPVGARPPFPPALPHCLLPSHDMALDVAAEVGALAAAVRRLGRATPDGGAAVPFGVLFRETADECERVFVCV